MESIRYHELFFTENEDTLATLRELSRLHSALVLQDTGQHHVETSVQYAWLFSRLFDALVKNTKVKTFYKLGTDVYFYYGKSIRHNSIYYELSRRAKDAADHMLQYVTDAEAKCNNTSASERASTHTTLQRIIGVLNYARNNIFTYWPHPASQEAGYDQGSMLTIRKFCQAYGLYNAGMRFRGTQSNGHKELLREASIFYACRALLQTLPYRHTPRMQELECAYPLVNTTRNALIVPDELQTRTALVDKESDWLDIARTEFLIVASRYFYSVNRVGEAIGCLRIACANGRATPELDKYESANSVSSTTYKRVPAGTQLLTEIIPSTIPELAEIETMATGMDPLKAISNNDHPVLDFSGPHASGR